LRCVGSGAGVGPSGEDRPSWWWLLARRSCRLRGSSVAMAARTSSNCSLGSTLAPDDGVPAASDGS
jgi:hypothetical protein